MVLNSKIRLLHVGDNKHHQEIIEEIFLKKDTDFELVQTGIFKKFEQYVKNQDFDVIICDFNMIGFNGLQLLQYAKNHSSASLLIIITGIDSEDLANEAIKTGKVDCVIKSIEHVFGLANTIKKFLEINNSEKELKSRQEVYKTFFEDDLSGNFISSADGKLLDCNSAYLKLLGFKNKEQALNTNLNIIYPKHAPHETLLKLVKAKGKLEDFEYELKRLNGEKLYVITNIFGYFNEKGKLISLKGYFINNTKHKLAEVELSKLARIAEQSLACIIITNLKGEIEYANPKFITVSGYNLEEVIGKNLQLLKSEHPSSEEYKNPWESINDGRELQERFQNKKKNEEIYFDSATISPILDEKGNVTHFLAIKEDVTAHRITEDALKKSEAIYRNLIETIPDGIYKSTPEGKFVEVNPAMVKMLGYNSKEELLAIDIIRDLYFDLEDRDSLVLNTNNEELGVFPLKKKDGTKIWIEDHGTYVRDESGKILYHEGIMRDVTERIKAEQALKLSLELVKDSEIQLKYSQKVARLGYYIFDIESGIWRNSEMLDEIFGIGKNYKRDFKGWINIIDKGQQQEMLDYFQNQVLKGNQVFDKEYKVINKKNKTAFWVHGLGTLELDAAGNLIKMFGTIQDITDRKKVELELLAAKEKAEESDHLKTAFLHNISHEIRTPMNAIVGFSDFLKDRELPFEKQVKFVDIISKSSNQLLSIITDIISISTIEAGQEKIIAKETDINNLLKNLYHQFLPIAEARNLHFELRISSAEIKNNILTDETKLIQILSNLIGNALKFTENGHVIFGYTKKHKTLEFFVEDTGIGVPEEMYDSIFDRFRQIEITETRKYSGSGLGLSISKAYVELLGGKIWLQSVLNKKTTFNFTIPIIAYKNKATNSKTKKKILIASNKIKNILVAEDEDSNFILLEALLEDSNINLLRAINGVEAVEICKTQPVDLVLMDIKMPMMDGYEATKKIRAFNLILPIIAQTAYTTKDDENKAIECGFTDFISKPFSKEMLISKINEQLYKQ